MIGLGTEDLKDTTQKNSRIGGSKISEGAVLIVTDEFESFQSRVSAHSRHKNTKTHQHTSLFTALHVRGHLFITIDAGR